MFDNFPLWPVQASTSAANVDALYIFFLVVSVAMTALLYVILIFFAARYRRRPGIKAVPNEGSLVLELAWSIAPMFVFVAMFLFGAVVYFQERTPPKDATEIYVVAKQWMWKLEHMEGQREINELHVPVGQNVKLIMTSQDVIHSFYVPAFRLKTDVLPGRYTIMWFRATKPGTYHLFCAEYCGTQHSGMIGSVVVMEPAQYQAWTNGGSTGPLSAAGEKLFSELGCGTCHRSDSQGRGPSLQGVFGSHVTLEDGRTLVADENYVRESILDPGAKVVRGFKPVMPTFQGLVSEEQMSALLAYIKSLAPAKPAETLNKASLAAPDQSAGKGSQVQ
jgi:cytochrome c oxidase subunit 2